MTQRLPVSVLFPCSFNGVRSPMVAGLMKQMFGSRLFVESCGAQTKDADLIVVFGENAAAVVGLALAIAAAIPGARCIELPSAHLSNYGAAAAFNASVLGFLG